MSEFIGGIELSRRFYEEAVRPILDAEFPGLPHSAALIGYGSEVLGYDTPRSTDHEWGPRLLLFLSDADLDAHGPRIVASLAERLPRSFHGYSTHFGPTDEEGTRRLAEPEAGPIDHKVEVVAVDEFLRDRFGFDVHGELGAADWLTIPEQKLLELTGGDVFHDGLGTLEPLRAKLRYYPHDVWLHLLAAQWRRIEQQEAFVGRTAEVGDKLGSAVIAATLMRDVMRLCFLMERRYAPYSKWFGTAFSRLACAATLTPVLERALHADSFQDREEQLSTAYEHVAGMHNALGITPPLDPRVRPFFGRPFQVIFANRFVEAITDAITDPTVKAIPGLYGSTDQLSDNTDVLSNPTAYRRLRTLNE